MLVQLKIFEKIKAFWGPQVRVDISEYTLEMVYFQYSFLREIFS